jgi:hypothetical protein
VPQKEGLASLGAERIENLAPGEYDQSLSSQKNPRTAYQKNPLTYSMVSPSAAELLNKSASQQAFSMFNHVADASDGNTEGETNRKGGN